MSKEVIEWWGGPLDGMVRERETQVVARWWKIQDSTNRDQLVWYELVTWGKQRRLRYVYRAKGFTV